MQDFRNLNEQTVNNQGINRLPRDPAIAPMANQNSGINDTPQSPKIGFFKARLNKDNFWNLMFWLGIGLGIAMSEIFNSVFGFLISIFILPKILTMFNPVIHLGDKHFVNSRGVSLDDKLPKHLDLVFFAIILSFIGIISISIFGSFFKIKGLILFHLRFTSFIGFLLFIPTLYFVIRNCPISILFNKNSWCKEVIGLSKANKPNNNLFNSSFPDTSNRFNSSDLYSNPSYKHLAGNIHHRY